MSSRIQLSLRPWIPPFAFAASNAMRIALALFTPCTAVTPERSVIVPKVICVSVTPRAAAAARPMSAGVTSIAAPPASVARREIRYV